MSWYLEAIAGIVFISIVFKGYKNGFMLSIIGFTVFIAAYYLSYILAEPVGKIIYAVTGLYRFIAVPIGGFVVFFLVNLIGVIPTIFYKRAMRTEIKSDDGKSTYLYKPSFFSRFSGMCLMLPIALFMVSFVYWADRVLNPKNSTEIKRMVSFPAKSAVESGLECALSDDDPKCFDPEKLSKLISNPIETSDKINAVINDPDIKELIKDKRFIDAIRTANKEKIYNNKNFSWLLADDDAMKKLHEIGFVPKNYKSADYKEQLVDRLIKVGERMKEIQKEPEFGPLIEKFQTKDGITKEKVSKLLSDKRFLKLVDKMIYETQ